MLPCKIATQIFLWYSVLAAAYTCCRIPTGCGTSACSVDGFGDKAQNENITNTKPQLPDRLAALGGGQHPVRQTKNSRPDKKPPSNTKQVRHVVWSPHLTKPRRRRRPPHTHTQNPERVGSNQWRMHIYLRVLPQVMNRWGEPGSMASRCALPSCLPSSVLVARERYVSRTWPSAAHVTICRTRQQNKNSKTDRRTSTANKQEARAGNERVSK